MGGDYFTEQAKIGKSEDLFYSIWRNNVRLGIYFIENAEIKDNWGI